MAAHCSDRSCRGFHAELSTCSRSWRDVFLHGGHPRRRPIFEDVAYRSLLGDSTRECQRDWPFKINAIVLLPDHLHAIWTLPPGDTNYSGRWSVLKASFTKKFLAAGGVELGLSKGKLKEGRRGIWQRRYWEHTSEDEDDFEAHFDYIHYNPVKHGYVRCPHEWKPSSFHRWVERGVYPIDWARGGYPPPKIVDKDYGEPE